MEDTERGDLSEIHRECARIDAECWTHDKCNQQEVGQAELSSSHTAPGFGKKSKSPIVKVIQVPMAKKLAVLPLGKTHNP